MRTSFWTANWHVSIIGCCLQQYFKNVITSTILCYTKLVCSHVLWAGDLWVIESYCYFFFSGFKAFWLGENKFGTMQTQISATNLWNSSQVRRFFPHFSGGDNPVMILIHHWSLRLGLNQLFDQNYFFASFFFSLS